MICRRLHRLLCRVLGHHYRFVDDDAFWLWIEEAEPKAVLSKSTITYFVRCRRCGR